jgi:tetratricopeptide (TPR) repeat protein
LAIFLRYVILILLAITSLSASDVKIQADNLVKSGKEQEALALYKDYLEQPSNPEKAKVLIKASYLHKTLQATLSFLLQYHKTIEKTDKDLYMVYRQIGLLHSYLGNFNESKQAYIQAMTLNPTDFLSAIEVAFFDLDGGLVQSAMNKAFSIYKDCKETRIKQRAASLMFIGATMGGNSKVGLAFLKQEMTWLNANASPSIYYTLFHFYDTLGMSKEAEAVKTMLLKKFAKTPEAWLLLNKAYLVPNPSSLLLSTQLN